jgi:hypothetical protein
MTPVWMFPTYSELVGGHSLSTITLPNGRTYSTLGAIWLGTPVPVPDFDVAEMETRGWIPIDGPIQIVVGGNGGLAGAAPVPYGIVFVKSGAVLLPAALPGKWVVILGGPQFYASGGDNINGTLPDVDVMDPSASNINFFYCKDAGTWWSNTTPD